MALHAERWSAPAPATGCSTASSAAGRRTRGWCSRGDLAKFPFRNPKDGTFRVTARVTDGLLDYAQGWPKIDGISGELLFEGAGMTSRPTAAASSAPN